MCSQSGRMPTRNSRCSIMKTSSAGRGMCDGRVGSLPHQAYTCHAQCVCIFYTVHYCMCVHVLFARVCSLLSRASVCTLGRLRCARLDRLGLQSPPAPVNSSRTSRLSWTGSSRYVCCWLLLVCLMAKLCVLLGFLSVYSCAAVRSSTSSCCSIHCTRVCLQ